MKIPLIKPDLPQLSDVADQFAEVLDSGKITNFSKYVTQFEQETGEYLGAHAVTVSSGTLGLLCSLSALGVTAGQKVILPSFTFMATAQAVLFAGAIPVFADIEDDFTLSPGDLEYLLQQHDNVGAIIAVHMYGLPARVADIEDVVSRHAQRANRRIPVLYDAAHAFGAALHGKRVGGFGDAEVFSLSVTKALVAVEGGLVTTKAPEIAERIRRMRNYGILSNYNAHFPGMNGKMSEFHAIVGLHNLHHLDHYLAERQAKAAAYRNRIQASTAFRTMLWDDSVTHTFKDFTITIPSCTPSDIREHIIGFLADRGIETRPYFHPPVHEQAFFRRFSDRSLPRTECLSKRVITLPFYTTMTTDEIDYVVDSLAAAERKLV